MHAQSTMPVVGLNDMKEENDDDERQAYYAGGNTAAGGGRCATSPASYPILWSSQTLACAWLPEGSSGLGAWPWAGAPCP